MCGCEVWHGRSRHAPLHTLSHNIVHHSVKHCAAAIPLQVSMVLPRVLVEDWRLAKLALMDKLKINYLILLLSSTDGPLLRYMYVFRIMQNVQENFVSGILYSDVFNATRLQLRGAALWSDDTLTNSV